MNRNGIVRRGGVRGPRRNVPVSAGSLPVCMYSSECSTNHQPTSAGNHHPDTVTSRSRPQLVRRRSASCSDLDWLKNGLDWQTVESSPYLSRSGSDKSVYADGPVLDIRHDCVKSSSPTIIHQQRPYDLTPLAAEVLQCDNSGEVVQAAAINSSITSEKVHIVKVSRFSRAYH